MSIRWSVMVLISAIAVPALAAESSFDYCTVCHGAQGNGNVAIHAPRIAGLEPWYLRAQFAAFRAGWRGVHADDAPGNEMRPVAQALTDAEIDQAVAYVGGLTPRTPPITVMGDVAHGRELYAACGSCHGAAGQGNEALHAPALAMRSDWYLVAELRDYRAGLRGSAPGDTYGQQMQAMAMTLRDDAAVNDVVAYIDTLR